MEDENTPDVKLSTKKSWITVESMIAAIIMSVALTGTWIGVDYRTNANQTKIEELGSKFDSYVDDTNTKLSIMDGKIDELLIEARIKNEIASIKVADRWTSQMMADYNFELLEVLRAECDTDIKASDMPNIKDIQRSNGYYTD